MLPAYQFDNKQTVMPEKQTRPFLLVDGSSYLYRAFHVPQLQQLTDSRG